MRYELVSLVLVLAVAGGLLLGTGMPGGFFSAMFSHAQSPDDSQLSGDNVKGADTSGFKVNIKASGSKTTSDDGGTDGQTDGIDEVTSPPITGMTGGGSGGGGDSGASSSPICTVDEKRCDGAILQQCSSDGMNWETLSVCDYGCDAIAMECNPEPSTLPAINTNVSVAPSSLNVNVGETFPLDIMIETEEDIFAASAKITYDNMVLNATDVMEGDFLNSDGKSTYPVTMIEWDNGTIYHDNTRFDTRVGVSGTYAVFTILFEALVEGNSAIIIDSEALDIINATANLDSIGVNIINGEVNVHEE